MSVRLWTASLIISTARICAQTGLLEGIAVDATYKPVPKAHVTLTSNSDHKSQSLVTDGTGKFQFTAPLGSYLLKAEDDTMDVSIAAGKPTRVQIVLQPQYFDKPAFTVAGVTDNTYRGGHGADTVLRSSEALTKQTAALTKPNTAELSGQPLKAVQQLQQAAEANPSESNLFDWGTELLSHRAPEPAVEIFRRGVRSFSRSTRMLLGLASAQYAAGYYDAAAAWFFKATDLNPSDPKPYLFLAHVQRREITDSPGYEERMARFAQLHPENSSANYYYAVTLSNNGQSTRAVDLLKKAIELDPHFAPAYLELGTIQAAAGDYNSAIHQYRETIELDSTSEEAHYRLAEAYRLTGDRAEAAAELARYNQISGQSADKRERERRDVQQFVISLKSQ